MTVYLWLNTCNFLTQKRAGAADILFTDCINKDSFWRTLSVLQFISSSVVNNCTECSKIFPQVILCRIQHNSDTRSSELQLLFSKTTVLRKHSRNTSTNFLLTSVSGKGSSTHVLWFTTGISKMKNSTYNWLPRTHSGQCIHCLSSNVGKLSCKN